MEKAVFTKTFKRTHLEALRYSFKDHLVADVWNNDGQIQKTRILIDSHVRCSYILSVLIDKSIVVSWKMMVVILWYDTAMLSDTSCALRRVFQVTITHQWCDNIPLFFNALFLLPNAICPSDIPHVYLMIFQTHFFDAGSIARLAVRLAMTSGNWRD